MSQRCHNRTHAPQQIAIHLNSHTRPVPDRLNRSQACRERCRGLEFSRARRPQRPSPYNRRSSSRSEFPLQAAEIVVHLRRRRLRKHEVRSTLEKALDLCVKSVAANDPLLRFKERAVRGVNLRDRDRSARGIPLPEYFDQVLFHQNTACVAHDRPSLSMRCGTKLTGLVRSPAVCYWLQPDFNSAASIGSFRSRLPVAAKIALVTAGAIAEVPASPMPPGGSEF